MVKNLLNVQQFIMELNVEFYFRIEEHIPNHKEEFRINNNEIDTLLVSCIKGYFDLSNDNSGNIRELFEFS